MKIDFPFTFGDEVQDVVSGLKGIVIAMTQWLNGCQRIVIQPKGLKDGKMQEGQTIDVQQLKLVKRAAITLPQPVLEPAELPQRTETPRRTGGPAPAPVRAADPRRM